MANDEELTNDQLPPGLTPVWIEPPEEASHVQMLERVKDIIGQEDSDVMVLWHRVLMHQEFDVLNTSLLIGRLIF